MTNPLGRLRAALAERYTIERELGRGGTATVYLATDLRHDRPVAIKVFQPDLAVVLGPERFLREIKTTARLTHPHILPLHDSGEADGFLYCVMPFVDGESLRERLEQEKQLPLDDALRIAREVADALSYAHTQGVVHRDIKPENILLESGHAVVADFGIARAIDVAGGERLTETGIAIGTPAYMSPEQASGSRELDGRSDLYSLGCVLYEMLAGVPPFAGPTAESLIQQHLAAEPPTITGVRPSVPSWTAAALTRALAKLPADRFNPVAQFGEAITHGITSEAAYRSVPTSRTRRRRIAAGVLSAAVVLAVLGIIFVQSLTRRPFTVATSNNTRVTYEPGLDFQPAISPDGSEVAYVVGPIESSRIVVRSAIDVATGSESRLDVNERGYYRSPSWTADGASVRFWGCTPSGRGCGWKEVGKLGGTARTVSAPVTSYAVAWSSDGRQVAFAVGDSILASSADGFQRELLAVHMNATLSPHSLAWSPDGRWIAYVNGNPQWRTSANVNSSSIWILNAEGGIPVQITDHEHLNVSPQWLSDSRHLLFVSDRDGRRGIHAVEVGPEGPVGPPVSVPGSSDPHSISVSADGKKLAYATFTVEQNIWSVPIPRSEPVSIGEAVPVTTGLLLIEEHDVSWDGKWLVYDSELGRIYKRPLEGGEELEVVEMEGSAFAPRWSPDGTEIAFYGGLEGDNSIYVVSADGGMPEQLTDFPGWEQVPKWSPDGRSIAFTRGTGRPFHEWIVRRDSVGGPWKEPELLTDQCGFAEWAPDGRSLVCEVGRRVLLLISAAGETVTRIAVPPSLSRARWPRFSPDGSRILFFATAIADDVIAAWSMPLEGGDPERLVVFDEPSLFHSLMGPNISVGPEHLYFTLAEYEADVWVMDLEWPRIDRERE